MNKTISVSVNIPAAKHKEMVSAATKTGLSLSAFIRQTVYAALDAQKKDGATCN